MGCCCSEDIDFSEEGAKIYALKYSQSQAFFSSTVSWKGVFWEGSF
jgi:hypothetical protein